MKKWIFVFSFVVILLFGISFADLLPTMSVCQGGKCSVSTDDTSKIVVENKDVDIVLENNKFKDFLIAWILTVLIETVALFDILKLFFKKDNVSNLRILVVGVLASTVTLPLLRFVIPLFIKDEMWYAVIGELLVTLLEVFIIKYGLKISWGKAILASVVCNLCSYLLGLLIM